MSDGPLSEAAALHLIGRPAVVADIAFAIGILQRAGILGETVTEDDMGAVRPFVRRAMELRYRGPHAVVATSWCAAFESNFFAYFLSGPHGRKRTPLKRALRHKTSPLPKTVKPAPAAPVEPCSSSTPPAAPKRETNKIEAMEAAREFGPPTKPARPRPPPG